jgi:hypothetical protein
LLLLVLLPLLPLLAPVFPLVAVVGGLLEVSRLFVQPDKMNSMMMLAKINFFILLCFSGERIALFYCSQKVGARNSEWVFGGKMQLS